MFDANGVEAEQCLSVLRQLGRTGILTLHALQELDGGGLSLAALRACGCVISLLDFTTFMLWLQSADVHLSDKVHPDSGIEQSVGSLGLFSTSPAGRLRPCSYAVSKYASQ